jgi:hypothetical protein
MPPYILSFDTIKNCNYYNPRQSFRVQLDFQEGTAKGHSEHSGEILTPLGRIQSMSAELQRFRTVCLTTRIQGKNGYVEPGLSI